MDLNRRDVEDLLGAWALDALDPVERRAVEQRLAGDPELAERTAQLRSTLGRLDERTGEDLPAHVVNAILTAAESERRPAAPASSPLDTYAHQVEALRSLLGTLDDADWTQTAHPYRWTVHGLVAHLLVIERYTAALLGLEGAVPVDTPSHLRAGTDVIELELSREPAATAGEWASVAGRVVDGTRLLDALETAPPVDFHGWIFTVPQLLVARSFEVWTHADDIRRAVGRPTVVPAPADLRAMSMLSVSSLPTLASITAPGRPDFSARVVLTGDGGGVFDLGGTSGRRALIVADVVEYCRLAARRVSIDEFEHHAEGDHELVRDMFAAARAFAV